MENSKSSANKLEVIKKLIKVGTLLFNIITIIVYATLSAITIVKDFGNTYTYILLCIVVVNILMSLLIAILNFCGKKKSASYLKDSKTAVAIFKKLVNLSNLVMGVVACVGSFSIKDSSAVLSLIIAIVSISFVVIQILFTIVIWCIKKYIKKKTGVVLDAVGEIKTSLNTYIDKGSEMKNKFINKLRSYKHSSQEDVEEELSNNNESPDSVQSADSVDSVQGVESVQSVDGTSEDNVDKK